MTKVTSTGFGNSNSYARSSFFVENVEKGKITKVIHHYLWNEYFRQKEMRKEE